MAAALPAILTAVGVGYSAYSANKNKPRRPDRISQPAESVTGKDTQPAADELMRRMAKLRRANMTSQLTTPNVKRKTLGAGL